MTANRGRRRPKYAADTERIRIIYCKYCRQKITFSYGSIGRDGKKIACDLSGIAHVCDGGSRR
jgi:hypothetical protein